MFSQCNEIPIYIWKDVCGFGFLKQNLKDLFSVLFLLAWDAKLPGTLRMAPYK